MCEMKVIYFGPASFFCNVILCEQHRQVKVNTDNFYVTAACSVGSLCALESCVCWKFLPASATHNLNPSRTRRNVRNRVTLPHSQMFNPYPSRKCLIRRF